jgi:beta-glucosidase
MAKHFVVNDQEHERFRASVEVDEHVLRELYLLPFEMLVKDADIAAMMSADNRLRGVYATECRPMLTDVLRTEGCGTSPTSPRDPACCAPGQQEGRVHP